VHGNERKITNTREGEDAAYSVIKKIVDKVKKVLKSNKQNKK